MPSARVISTSSPAAAAESPPGCIDVDQIGGTAYIKWDGQTVASVKQYKGCGKNYAYTYAWQSFRDDYSSWQVTAWINTSSNRLGLRNSTG